MSNRDFNRDYKNAKGFATNFFLIKYGLLILIIFKILEWVGCL